MNREDYEDYEDRINNQNATFFNQDTHKTITLIKDKARMNARKETKVNVHKLASAHWDYVGSVLTAHGIAPDSKLFCACAFHYISAFEHGWKHGVEHMKEQEELY